MQTINFIETGFQFESVSHTNFIKSFNIYWLPEEYLVANFK